VRSAANDVHLIYLCTERIQFNQCSNFGAYLLILATRIGGMTSVTIVPAEGGFARTISSAPLSDGIQAC
jgi:hypothetical protein